MLCRTLEGHAHRINTLALNTDYVMRTGAYNPADAKLVKEDVTDSRECFNQELNVLFAFIHCSSTSFRYTTVFSLLLLHHICYSVSFPVGS